MPKINTFLIGAQKAGSTTLYSWLAQHPEIEAPDWLKDLHFFTSEEYYPKGTDWLEDKYNDPKATVHLHSAVNYIFRAEETAQKIKKYNPEAKIILVLRDPVKRAFSAYKFFKKLEKEQRSFEEALQDEKEGKFDTLQEKDDYAYMAHGFYAEQISTWLSYFKKRQVLILIYEELFANPQGYLKQIFSFLELNNTDFEVNLESKNVSGTVKHKALNKLIYDQNNSLRKALVKTGVKHLVPRKWRGKFYTYFRDWNTKTGGQPLKLSQPLYTELSELYKKDRLKLEKMLDRDFDNLWRF